MIIGADSAALHLVLHGCTKVAAEVWWGIKHRRALVAANCLLKTMLGEAMDAENRTESYAVGELRPAAFEVVLIRLGRLIRRSSSLLPTSRITA